MFFPSHCPISTFVHYEKSRFNFGVTEQQIHTQTYTPELKKYTNHSNYPLSTLKHSKLNYNNQSHRNFILIRKRGISYIETLFSLFNYSQNIKHKAFSYLDTIYLSNHPVTGSFKIEFIAAICSYLAIIFNCSQKEMNKDNLSLIVGLIPDYKLIMVECLKAIDYDLMNETALDTIQNFFYKIREMYPLFAVSSSYEFLENECIRIVNKFIRDDRAMDFTSQIIAVTIIRHIFINSKMYIDVKSLINSMNIVLDNKNEELQKCNLVLRYAILSCNNTNNNNNYYNKNYRYNNFQLKQTFKHTSPPLPMMPYQSPPSVINFTTNSDNQSNRNSYININSDENVNRSSLLKGLMTGGKAEELTLNILSNSKKNSRVIMV